MAAVTSTGFAPRVSRSTRRVSRRMHCRSLTGPARCAGVVSAPRSRVLKASSIIAPSHSMPPMSAAMPSFPLAPRGAAAPFPARRGRGRTREPALNRRAKSPWLAATIPGPASAALGVAVTSPAAQQARTRANALDGALVISSVLRSWTRCGCRKIWLQATTSSAGVGIARNRLKYGPIAQTLRSRNAAGMHSRVASVLASK